MSRSGVLISTILRASLAFTVVVGAAAVSSAYAQEAVRPEIGKPLQAASALLKSNKFKDALAKIREVDSVPNKTANETYLIESMRGSAASGAGDNETIIKSFESVIASGKAPAATQLKLIEALAGAHYRARDYAATNKWATRYLRDGGGNSQIRTLLIQSYFQSGDFANSAKESLIDIQADEKAGRTPSEEKLQLLANSYLRQKNSNGYIATIEKLLNYYPKKSLWADMISRLQRKSGFSDRLALDVYRLQLATGNLTATNDYMEMSQLALQAGFPGEAKKVVDEGYANGALGKGTDVDIRRARDDFRALLAGDAAAHTDQHAFGLQVLDAAEVAEHFLLRLLAHRAGVEQDQVGLVDVARRLVTLRSVQHVGHLVRVVLVHLATESLDEDFFLCGAHGLAQVIVVES